MAGFQAHLWHLASRNVLDDQLHSLENAVRRLQNLVPSLPEGMTRKALAREVHTLNETANTIRQALDSF